MRHECYLYFQDRPPRPRASCHSHANLGHRGIALAKPHAALFPKFLVILPPMGVDNSDIQLGDQRPHAIFTHGQIFGGRGQSRNSFSLPFVFLGRCLRRRVRRYLAGSISTPSLGTTAMRWFFGRARRRLPRVELLDKVETIFVLTDSVFG